MFLLYPPLFYNCGHIRNYDLVQKIKKYILLNIEHALIVRIVKIETTN